MLLNTSPIAYLLDLRPHIFSILTDASSDFLRLQADDSSNKAHTLPHAVHQLISFLHSWLVWLRCLRALLVRPRWLHRLTYTSRSLLGLLTNKGGKGTNTLPRTTDQLFCSFD